MGAAIFQGVMAAIIVGVTAWLVAAMGTTEIGEFIPQFAQATLENWQSEFLHLFSFVVLAALLIHRGSAESRDSDDRMEEALKRIESRLDALKR